MDEAKKAGRTEYIFAMVKGFNDDDTFEAVASTAALDRQGEIIEPEAWVDSLDIFRDNPVIMSSHQHRLFTGHSSVIGRAVCVDVVDGVLAFRGRFAPTELGKEHDLLYRERYQRAFSVGFLCQEGEWRNVETGEEKKIKRLYVHTRVELLEISAVAVPANPEALARMRAAAAKSDAFLTEQLTEQMETLADRCAAKAAEAVSGLLGQKLPELLDERLADHQTKLMVRLTDQLDEIKCRMPDSLESFSALPAPGADGTADGSAAAKDGASQRVADLLNDTAALIKTGV